ncbi:MAG: hypothetical protein JSV91_10315 [Phycisphaerales bacterium]|nr:MAG: hypothetical protein JSV91_10315 [Phycisphaerales bacterium]
MNARCILSVLTIGAVALPAAARWPDDPSQNLQICARPDLQYSTRIALASDHGCYISWVDRGGGWDIYLQRLDAAGSVMWAPGGVRAVSRSGQATQGYDMAVDGGDHVIIAFHDVRDGFNQIAAVRIGPAGQPVWGADGVQLTDLAGLEYVCRPGVAATDDDEIVIAWSHSVTYTVEDLRLEMQRLAPDGSPVWDEMMVITPDLAASFWLCDLNAANDGAVIASWVRHLNWYADRHIWAGKFDRDGEALWGADSADEVPHVVIFDAGTIQYGCFPEFVNDGLGGAVFSWYRSYPWPMQVFAQHVLTEGTEMFPHNGAAVSTSVRDRAQPEVCHNPATRETFVFWVEHIYGDAIKAVYGQKLDTFGNRMWGEEGVEIVPGTATQYSEIRITPCADGVMVFWIEEPQWEDCYLNAARLDGDGSFVWDPEIAVVSTICADKGDLAMVMNDHGVTAAVWSDDRNIPDHEDIYAQNITTDCVFGMRPGDVDGDGVVDITDLFLVLGDWGCSAGYCPGELNDDGVVDIDDVFVVLSDWG